MIVKNNLETIDQNEEVKWLMEISGSLKPLMSGASGGINQALLALGFASDTSGVKIDNKTVNEYGGSYAYAGYLLKGAEDDIDLIIRNIELIRVENKSREELDASVIQEIQDQANKLKARLLNVKHKFDEKIPVSTPERNQIEQEIQHISSVKKSMAKAVAYRALWKLVKLHANMTQSDDNFSDYLTQRDTEIDRLEQETQKSAYPNIVDCTELNNLYKDIFAHVDMSKSILNDSGIKDFDDIVGSEVQVGKINKQRDILTRAQKRQKQILLDLGGMEQNFNKMDKKIADFNHEVNLLHKEERTGTAANKILDSIKQDLQNCNKRIEGLQQQTLGEINFKIAQEKIVNLKNNMTKYAMQIDDMRISVSTGVKRLEQARSLITNFNSIKRLYKEIKPRFLHAIKMIFTGIKNKNIDVIRAAFGLPPGWVKDISKKAWDIIKKGTKASSIADNDRSKLESELQRLQQPKGRM